jgi:Flp pilus assembly pilin Flp
MIAVSPSFSLPEGAPLSWSMLNSFALAEDGATAIEYGLLAAMFATLMIGSSGSLRSSLLTLFGSLSNAVANAN